MHDLSIIAHGILIMCLMVLLGVLVILFVSVASEKGMILNFLRKARLPEWIVKPLYGCTVCMASIWGTFVYGSLIMSLKLGGVDFPLSLTLFLWPVYCITLSGAMVMYNEIME